MRQPTRSARLVFLSKTGRMLSEPMLSGYWSQVKAAAGRLDFDFYLATKHYGVHLLYRLGLSTPLSPHRWASTRQRSCTC